MKKVLAAVLAAAMSLSMASVAFAAKLELTAPSNGYSGGKGDYALGTHANGAQFLLTDADNRSEMDVKEDIIYTWDDDEAVFFFKVPTGEKLRADVNDGKISVSVRKVDSKVADPLNLDDKGNAKKYDEYKITVTAKYGPRDFDSKDWTVELDCMNKTYFIKGKGAYSDTQEVTSGDRLTVRKSAKGDTSATTGAIFNFREVLDDEVRIVCNDYVDVYFKGNYGTDKENMRVVTDKIDEIEDFFGDIDVDYYDFIGTPKFATKVKVIIDGDPNAFLYEYNKKTGDITKVDATYESDGWSFTTKNLGTYVLTEEEYDEGNVEKEDPADKEPTTTPSEKDNPGTGANDMVGVAAALAVVSLVAAGAVAFKKASK